MKIGIVISVIILLAIGGLLMFGNQGVAQRATSLTAANKLEAQVLPSSLPSLYEPSKADENATDLYEAAIDICYMNEGALTRSPRPEGMSTKVVDGLIAAMDAGRVKAGMLDSYVPVVVMAEPKFGDAILVAQDVTLEWANNRYREGKEQEAVRAMQALFAFGHRLFAQSVRMSNRFQGLQLMQASLMQLSTWKDSVAMADLPPDAVITWLEAVEDIQKVWLEKMSKLLRSSAPPIGDVINMAKNEKDLSLRIEAVLTLSIVKHAPKSDANQRAIEAAIAEAQSDPNPLIAEAGKSAEAFTVDQLRGL